jgi:DNA-binding CsgD family transcriptional regulator
VLSTREREILRLVSEGKTNIDIAKILAISAFTVKNHMQRIIKKLNAANRTEAVSNYHLLNPQQPQRRNAASSPFAIQAQA